MWHLKGRKTLKRLALVLLYAALPAAVFAHDTWLSAQHPATPPGSFVTLDLTSGMAFPSPETAIKPDRVARASVRLAGTTSEIKHRKAASKSLRFSERLLKPGIATFWVELAPKAIELKPAEAKEYLDEIGASPAIRRAWDVAGVSRRWREIYVKYAKAYVRVGSPVGDRSWAEPTGVALEIVPEQDPTSLRSGDELSVRVLLKGKAAASFPIGLVRAGDPQGTLTTTDASGRASFRLDSAGRWLLRGTDLHRSSKPETDWESAFTTLTFDVR
jgi:uncharacterized GH25 family protein